MDLTFAGTPTFAATILRGLLNSDHRVKLVISQPDRPRGRGRRLARTPVAQVALDAGIPLLQPRRIGEVAAEVSRQDALVVAAFGQILRPDSLYAARLGAFNVHASLLPKYRGAAPIERAIMNGETTTGVSLMQMDEGLDTGPVGLQLETPIPPDMTGGEATEVLAALGAKLAVDGMSMIEAQTLTFIHQDNAKATYAAKLVDEDRVIRWGEEAERVHDLVRALSPHMGARTFHGSWSGPIKVLRSRVHTSGSRRASPGEILPAKDRILVGCGSGILEVMELQAPGSRALPAREFLRGNKLAGAFGG